MGGPCFHDGAARDNCYSDRVPTLRVMSFNLRGALSPDGWNAWPLRRRLVRRLLAAHRPTILAAQEVVWPVERELGAALRGHARVRGGLTGRRLLGVRNPLFVDGSALVVERQGGLWLSDTPDRFSVAAGARLARGATWAVVRARASGRPIIFVNTHLDHEGAAARAQGVAVILGALERLGWPRVPAVLAGDFNANAGEALHASLLAAGFVDTWLAAGGDDDDQAFTFHGFTGRRVPPDRRIDWVLASPALRVVGAAIVRDAEPGWIGGGPRFPSDHFPVMADFALD
jgi:endonuclease/exonuclease/phosphatase family metal-dependent hydrolase